MQDDTHILVDSNPVPVEIIARNEGVELSDLMEWKKRLGQRLFCIVHLRSSGTE